MIIPVLSQRASKRSLGSIFHALPAVIIPLLLSPSGLIAQEAQTTPKSRSVEQTQGNNPVFKALKQSKGEMTLGLKAVYLKQQEARVLAQLKEQKVKLDPELLSWLRGDDQAYSAVFGSVYPSDPDILLNLAQLWAEQGAAFTKKHKNLSLAAAVARRGVGVGPLSGFSKWGQLYKNAAEAKAAGVQPATYLADPNRKPSRIKAKTAQDKIAYQAVAAYLKKHQLSHRQAFENKEHLAEIGRILKKNKSAIKAPACLKGLMVEVGKRPSAREQQPTVAAYNKWLVQHQQIKASSLKLEGNQRWPMFPVLKAPWPLLMPLSRTLPLAEADYIWQKFLGQHGGKRVHTYGPYRKGEKAQLPTYDPRPWHWNSWPATIAEGGVCGTMSTIAMGTYTALGRPVLKAGQPGHSCLVGYQVTKDGSYIGSLGQSVTAGPAGTGTAWLFQDGSTWKCSGSNSNAVHHYGLALSMNHGLDDYMEGRMALHIYKQLPRTEKQTLGRSLLQDCLKKNPYLTELWYTLARDCTQVKELLALEQQMKQLMQSRAVVEQAADGDASAAVEGADKEAGRMSDSTAKTEATYRKLVWETIMTYALAKPDKFDVRNQRLAYAYLNKEEKLGGPGLLARDHFQYALEGQAAYQTSLRNDLKRLMTDPPKGRKKVNQANKVIKERYAQSSKIVSDRQSYETFLWESLKLIPQKKAVVTKKDKKKKLSPIYETISKSLSRSYQKKPRNNTGKKQLQAMNSKLLASSVR